MLIPRPEELGFTQAERAAIMRIEDSFSEFLHKSYDPVERRAELLEKDAPKEFNAYPRAKSQVFKNFEKAGWNIVHSGNLYRFTPK